MCTKVKIDDIGVPDELTIEVELGEEEVRFCDNWVGVDPPPLLMNLVGKSVLAKVRFQKGTDLGEIIQDVTLGVAQHFHETLWEREERSLTGPRKLQISGERSASSPDYRPEASRFYIDGLKEGEDPPLNPAISGEKKTKPQMRKKKKRGAGGRP